jgi:hypothetical protein
MSEAREKPEQVKRAENEVGKYFNIIRDAYPLVSNQTHFAAELVGTRWNHNSEAIFDINIIIYGRDGKPSDDHRLKVEIPIKRFIDMGVIESRMLKDKAITYNISSSSSIPFRDYIGRTEEMRKFVREHPPSSPTRDSEGAIIKAQREAVKDAMLRYYHAHLKGDDQGVISVEGIKFTILIRSDFNEMDAPEYGSQDYTFQLLHIDGTPVEGIDETVTIRYSELVNNDQLSKIKRRNDTGKWFVSMNKKSNADTFIKMCIGRTRILDRLNALPSDQAILIDPKIPPKSNVDSNRSKTNMSDPSTSSSSSAVAAPIDIAALVALLGSNGTLVAQTAADARRAADDIALLRGQLVTVVNQIDPERYLAEIMLVQGETLKPLD